MTSRMPSLEALQSFVAIQQTGSFRAAASRVNLSPSAVSLQLGKLEEMLGCRLLERNARRVALTAEGERLLPLARRMLSLGQETLALFHEPGLHGVLTLSAPHDLGVSLVPGLLRRMAERYPEIRIDVRLSAAQQVVEGFVAGKCDVALFNDVGPPALPATDVWTEPLVWSMARGGVAASATPLPLAVAELGCAWRDAALAALEARGIAYRIAYGSDTSTGQVAALRADLAVAALPRSMLGEELVVVPDEIGLPGLPATHVRLAHDDGKLARLVAAMLKQLDPPHPG